MTFLKNLILFFLPGALILGLACYMRFWTLMPPEATPFLAMFPALTAIAVVLLSWRFNRTVVNWVVLMFFMVWLSLQMGSEASREYVFTTASILLPLNILFLAWSAERGFWSIHGLVRGILLLLQIGGLYWLYQSWAGEVIALLHHPLLKIDTSMIPSLTQSAAVTMLFSLLGIAARYIVKPEALTASFFWASGAIVFGFALPQEFAFWAGTACLVLIFGMFKGTSNVTLNDELTGLPVRRAMNEYLLTVGRHYTIAILDIDNFKKLDVTNGRIVSDQMLRMVASRIRSVSGGGKAFRYGDEEFALVFPNKDLDKTLAHLEILREQIGRSAFVLRGKKRPKKMSNSQAKAQHSSGQQVLRVTVSMGVAERNDNHTMAEQVIKAAHEALNQAKQNGGNRICHA